MNIYLCLLIKTNFSIVVTQKLKTALDEASDMFERYHLSAGVFEDLPPF